MTLLFPFDHSEAGAHFGEQSGGRAASGEDRGTGVVPGEFCLPFPSPPAPQYCFAPGWINGICFSICAQGVE